MKIKKIITISIVFGLLLMGTGLAPNAAFAQSANLALNKPATASSIEGAGFEASKAVDGSTSTRWASVDPATIAQWIYVDLGATTAISQVVLKWEVAYAKSYQVQVSNDASTWTTIFSTTTGNGGTDDLTGLSGSGRYVRVYATVRGTSYGYSLWEFEIYGSGGPTSTPTNTPTRTPTPTETQPSVSTIYQAEAASLGGGVTVDTNHLGFNGTGFVNFPLNGGFVQFNNADGGTGGNATLHVRYALGATAARTGLLTVNGASQNVTFSVTANWDTWAFKDIVVPLNSGTINTIRFESTGQDLANLDQMEIIPGGSGPTNTPTYTPTATHTPTRTPTRTPTQTQPPSGKIQWAGVRSSRYGISPFPDACGWTNAMTTMSGYFPGSTPTGVWLAGEIFFNGTNSGQDLNFPNPGGTWDSRIHFASSDQNESYLTYFDTHGIKVFLQFEPGYAPLDQLFQVTYNRYGQHPSVIGFGVDVEWYQSQCDGCANAPVSNSTAQTWENKVKSLNPNYRLFLKHYDAANLPSTYRGNIIFVDDSEQNGSYSNFLNEMINFANTFYPADVMYQIGYPSDKPWWSTLANPIPKTMGNDLASRTQQSHMGIIWVDFSLRDVLPSTCP